MLPSFWGNREPGQARHPVEQLRKEFDALVSQMFGSGADPESLRYWDLEVESTDEEIVVRAELPGFEPGEIDVEVRENVLTIQAEKRQEAEGEKRRRAYRRSMTLPAAVDQDQAVAAYRHGVLELRLPKKDQPRGKRIPVRSGSAGESRTAAEWSEQRLPGDTGEGPATIS